ncbi:MAG: 1-acyl-sn-glycerol-3-phosphate acyltransferase [Agathobacter sp.]|nr:1-acyl-sn-glycerol-3-phosphate acyltransferase [Agathobacter sp.]
MKKSSDTANKKSNMKNKYEIRSSKATSFFKKLAWFRKAIIGYFKPIIINEDNLCSADDVPVIYAPNHRSTLDPIIVNAIIGKHIHWAALLRFFEGTDSIFNNSKNPILCRFTAWVFRKLEYIPIDRKKDNPEAVNYTSVVDMISFLKINKKIGIFPEGTTSRPEGEEFGEFDPSFVQIAKKTKTKIQPITLYWFEDKKGKKRPVINFASTIDVTGKKVDEIYQEYLDVQKAQLPENKKKSEEYL